MTGRQRLVVAGVAAVAALAPGPVGEARAEVLGDLGAWLPTEIVARVRDADRSAVVPSSAPDPVTIICDTWKDTYQFRARPGQRVTCRNGASPIWRP